MYLHTLNIWNFRKYGINGDTFDSALPGLSISFNEGVNVLVGENDSGKTAIIDAIRYVLKTQSGEFIQFEEKDFYQNPSEQRTDELKIECIFKGFSDQDAGHFLEWIGLETNGDKTEYILKVWVYAKIKDNVIYPYTRAGLNSEGSYIEGEAKELLKVIYLKPLRDALSDMTHGNKSRLAQILKAHPIFKTTKDASGMKVPHDLEMRYRELKKQIDTYFSEEKERGAEITQKINTLLSSHFLTKKDERNAMVSLTANELSDILKQLDLILEDNKSGLGSLNLLCIAAELLLYTENRDGLKLTLIEELEAHLHPQYQLRIIDFISSKSNYGQFILTTHSTTLASKIPLKSLILCKENQVYPLGSGTKLFNSDYKFLERFLDATKSNLFFAQGLIVVEGDAENLLIPTIAELIDRPLHKYGISIVNVGSTAYKRYVQIFQRTDGTSINMPVSIISDIDVPCMDYYKDTKDGIPEVVEVNNTFVQGLELITTDVDYSLMPIFWKSKSQFEDYIKANKTKNQFNRAKPSIMTQLGIFYDNEPKKPLDEDILSQLREDKRSNLTSEWNNDNIKIFLPQKWTLEYDLACSALDKYIAAAIKVAKFEKNNPKAEITSEIVDEYINERISEEGAYSIFRPLALGNVSKASTAQYLAQILDQETTEVTGIIKSDKYLKYIVDAICHVTEPLTTESNE